MQAGQERRIGDARPDEDTSKDRDRDGALWNSAAHLLLGNSKIEIAEKIDI